MAIFLTYTVKSGDTLTRIAKDYETSVDALVALNALPGKNRIDLGQTLRIRQISETYYIVVKGDTAQKIATRFGVTLAALKTANALRDENSLAIGQKLAIPAGSTPPRPSSPAPVVSVAPVSPSTPPQPVLVARPVGHQLGDLSSKYEVSSGGCGTVSTGRGDRGGVSYGSYQLASTLGRPAEFLKHEGERWSAEFRGQEQGTPPFSATWKAIARREPIAFHAAQHDYIGRTHHAVQLIFVKSQTGVDLAACGAAVQDVVWSTAVQHGPNGKIVLAALKRVALRPGDARFDKELIQAIYAERGRRNAAGALAHFENNSRAVQDGVAARFTRELKDALDMLSAEGVRAAIGPVVTAPPAVADDLVKKAAKSLSDDEVRLLLEKYADNETVSDFIAGRKVAVALRKSTNTRLFRRGVYDDTILLAWREQGGRVRLKRFPGNTEPAGDYAFDGPKAAKGSSTDLNRDGRNDLGRLVPGTYHYVRQKTDFNGARYFIARDIQVTERDTNQDGNFTVGAGDGVDPSGAQRTMYIHQGGSDSTWSAGCQTIPKDNYRDFLGLVGTQPSLCYVLINAD